MKLISQEVSMKKVKFERKYILLTLVSLFIGYIGLRYYIKPEWFDWENQYYTVYNYKVSEIKAKKKVVKDLNIEFVHQMNEKVPQNQELTEKILSNWIPIEETSEIGPSFSANLLNDSIYQKLSFRFPDFNLPDNKRNINLIDILLFLYEGDTLYQVPEVSSEISYQLKNPKTGEKQTYFEYGNKPDFSLTPIFFTSSKNIMDDKLDFF